MPGNDEQLNLIVSQQGAQEVVNQLNKVAAAEDKVTAAAKSNAAAARQQQSSLLDLDKQVEKSTRLFNDYAAAKSKAAKAGEDGGSGGFKLNEVERGLNSSAALLGSNPISEGVRLIGDITGAIGDFNPVALAAAVAAAGVTTALKLLSDSAERAANAQQGLIDAANTAFDINFNAKELAQQKTKEQLAQEYDNIKAEIDLNAQKTEAAKQRKAAIDADYASLGSSINPQRRNDLGASGQKEVDELARLQTELAGLQNQLSTTSAAMNDTTHAAKALEQQQLQGAQEHLAAMQRNEQLVVRLNDLTATGTTKQIEARIAAITREISTLETYQSAAIEYAQSLEQGSEANRLASQQAESYGKQIDTLRTEQERLTGSTLELVKAREAEAAAIEYQKKQNEELAAAAKSYNDDLTRLNQQDEASRQKLRDSMDSIFDQAVKAAQSAYDKLVQAQADLERDLSREEDKAARDAHRTRIENAIKENEQEQDIYKSYRRKLRDIQNQEDEASFEAALNRDFSSLFNIGRNANSQRNQAAQDERDQIEDTRTAYQRQNDELLRSLETERQERLIANQQRIQDAIDTYNQERLQIDAQRRDQEAKAIAQRAREKAALDQQYQIRLQAAQNEIALVSRTEQERVAIMAAAQNALIQQARAILTATSGGSTGAGASGNNFNFSQTNHITSGANADAVGDIVEKRTIRVIKSVTGLGDK